MIANGTKRRLEKVSDRAEELKQNTGINVGCGSLYTAEMQTTMVSPFRNLFSELKQLVIDTERMPKTQDARPSVMPDIEARCAVEVTKTVPNTAGFRQAHMY
ncbi:hypothetical protein ACA910_007360 [Epithemia clementina (nom. ined.)]